MEPTQEPSSGSPARVVTLVFLLLIGFTLVLMALSFPVGLYAIFSGNLSTQLNSGSFAATYLWVGPLPAILPFEVPLGGMFVGLCVVYAAMFLGEFLRPLRPGPTIRASLKSGVEGLFASPFLAILIAIGFLDFTDTWFTYAVQAAGAPIGNPFVNVDAFLEFSSLTFAPLREEFGFRVLLIGVVALVLCMGRPAKQALKALWRPSVAYDGLAVRGATAGIVWAAVVFSSVTFGACHAVCGGGGWDWGKVIPATWGGLVLGYLYVRFGFPAAVLAHWGVDYFTSAFSFFGQAAYGINWANAPVEYSGQLLVDLDVVYLFGLACFLVVIYVGIKKAVAWRASRSQPGLVDKGPLQGVLAEE